MYGGGFRLAPRPGDVDGGSGGAALSKLRENVYKILLDEQAQDTQTIDF